MSCTRFVLPPHGRIPCRGTKRTRGLRRFWKENFHSNGRPEPNRCSSSTVEESWETGKRDDKIWRGEKTHSSENNGIYQVSSEVCTCKNRCSSLFIFQRFQISIACFFIRPFLEEQALLREKLKNMPTWKKDKDPAKRKTQPMVRDQLASYMYHDWKYWSVVEYWPIILLKFSRIWTKIACF